jgi:hypothetical protein
MENIVSIHIYLVRYAAAQTEFTVDVLLWRSAVSGKLIAKTTMVLIEKMWKFQFQDKLPFPIFSDPLLHSAINDFYFRNMTLKHIYVSRIQGNNRKESKKYATLCFASRSRNTIWIIQVLVQSARWLRLLNVTFFFFFDFFLKRLLDIPLTIDN